MAMVLKFKTHLNSGITLCAKNLQGCMPKPYVRHCKPWGKSMEIDPKHIQPESLDIIANNYSRHKNAGIPRWDVKEWPDWDVKRYSHPDASPRFTGKNLETWATRCLDNNSVLKPGLNVIEGIYGRDGNAFYEGPHNGEAQDVMANIIIFGKNAFYVDIIGTWLAGHEPGNFGLFHLAKERNFINTFNPKKIPLYEWNKDGVPTLSNLDAFGRTNLLTCYLTKPGEEKWHLCNEAYQYEAT